MHDIMITSLETIMAFNPLTGDYRFTLDELQNAKVANTEDTQDITGKGGRKLNSLKRNKAVVVSGTNGIISGGLLEAQVGGKFERKATKVMVPDYLTISDDKAITTFKAAGTVGSEIEAVYVRNEDGTLGVKLIQDTTASAGKFAYAPATKELSFAADEYPDGTNIAVYYLRQVQGDVLTNVSDHHSEKCALYIDALGEDKCNQIYHIQFYIPRADFAGNFDLDMGENQTVHAFEAKSLSGLCSSTGQLWTYTVFGVDAADMA